MASKPQPPAGGDVDIGWKLEVGTTVTFLCATIVVALRCLTRWKYSKRGWDDYLMVFALVLALLATIIDYVATNAGLGRHTFYLTYDQAVNQQFYSVLAQVFCVHALSFAKISIVASYIRVLRGSTNRFHQVFLWTIGGLVLIINTIVIITFYTACDPTEKSWNPRVPGTCWDINKKLAFFILQGAFSAFSDFLLAFYPFFFLNKLQVPKRTKAVILGLMALGTVTGIFAIIRTVETGTQLNPPPNAVPDASYSTVLGLTWAGMERNIAIMIGSIPALNPLAAPTSRFLKDTFGSSKSRLARSQSYQLSDNPGSKKLSEQDSRRPRSTPRGSQKSGTPMMNSSEDYASREYV